MEKHTIHTLYMLIKKWQKGYIMNAWDRQQFDQAKDEIKEMFPDFIFHEYNEEI